MTIEPFSPDHLSQLKELINSHFGAVIPGWSLTSDYIAKHLERNPGETLIDPWVIERKTLVVIHKHNVIAAAHLLRYGTAEMVGEHYQNMGEIGWLLAYPLYQNEAKALLNACHDQMRIWNVAGVMVSNILWFPVSNGTPAIWGHLTTVIDDAGYKISDHREAVFGGWLNGIPLPGPSPVEGVVVQRRFKDSGGVSFVAYLGDEEIGECQVEVDLTDGNERPSLIGWGELSSMHVKEEWRSRKIGSWLVQHGVEWLRMAGCSRIVLAVLADDEERGAGRFYNRFGWQPFVRGRYYEPLTLHQLDISAK